MQCFMAYPDLEKSVKCLDSKRLGNQIYNEGYCLIQGKWKNHPASKIWIGHKRALARYCLYGLEELEARGRSYPKWVDFFSKYVADEPDTGLPDIFGYEPYHASHRSQLLGKNYEWYKQFGWDEEPGALSYVWTRPESS